MRIRPATGKRVFTIGVKGLRLPQDMTGTPQNRRLGYAGVITHGQTLDVQLEVDPDCETAGAAS
jgi:hypothetical protein